MKLILKKYLILVLFLHIYLILISFLPSYCLSSKKNFYGFWERRLWGDINQINVIFLDKFPRNIFFFFLGKFSFSKNIQEIFHKLHSKLNLDTWLTEVASYASWIKVFCCSSIKFLCLLSLKLLKFSHL